MIKIRSRSKVAFAGEFNIEATREILISEEEKPTDCTVLWTWRDWVHYVDHTWGIWTPYHSYKSLISLQDIQVITGPDMLAKGTVTLNPDYLKDKFLFRTAEEIKNLRFDFLNPSENQDQMRRAVMSNLRIFEVAARIQEKEIIQQLQALGKWLEPLTYPILVVGFENGLNVSRIYDVMRKFEEFHGPYDPTNPTMAKRLGF